jgi:hypothetical protein
MSQPFFGDVVNSTIWAFFSEKTLSVFTVPLQHGNMGGACSCALDTGIGPKLQEILNILTSSGEISTVRTSRLHLQ